MILRKNLLAACSTLLGAAIEHSAFHRRQGWAKIDSLSEVAILVSRPISTNLIEQLT